MNKPHIIAVILAVIIFALLAALGIWQINQANERLLALQERAAGVYWNRPQPTPDPEPDPEPTLLPPRTTDFADVNPEDDVTRGMFTAMLASFDGADLTEHTVPRFYDVPEDEWYSAPVEWAAAEGIVTGVGNNNFAPDANISREQIAVMLSNYLRHKGYELPEVEAPGILDYTEISGWAFVSVELIRGIGVIPDRPDNTFDPKGKVTNAETDEIFERLSEWERDFEDEG